MKWYVTPDYYYAIIQPNQIAYAAQFETMSYQEIYDVQNINFLKPLKGFIRNDLYSKSIHSSSGKIFSYEWEMQLLAVVSINKWLKKSAQDIIGCWLPIHHISGWSLLWSSFVSGSLITFGNSLPYISICSLVNTQMYRLKYWGNWMKSHPMVLIGGGRNHFPTIPSAYGATETWAAHMIKQANRSCLLLYKSGKMLSNQEILLRGWVKQFQKGLWIKIGDIGCITKQGVWVVSRIDLAYKRAGKSVFLWQIEEAIQKANDMKVEVVVLAKEDEHMGVKWIAFVNSAKWPPLLPKEKYWQPDIVMPMPSYEGIKPLRSHLASIPFSETN
nr:o-succinylbenzoic acid-CoA ligase [Cyanidioschyzonaceae sp. 2]